MGWVGWRAGSANQGRGGWGVRGGAKIAGVEWGGVWVGWSQGVRGHGLGACVESERVRGDWIGCVGGVRGVWGQGVGAGLGGAPSDLHTPKY